jgi:NAD(P)-dependent dehydrogenase (short-subunit alcohol dehydrogenase family)
MTREYERMGSDTAFLRERLKYSTSDWKTAWITGASRGIGRELALRLAGEGVKVAVSSRNQALLGKLATLNPNIIPFPLDVTNQRATLRSLKAMSERLCGIDLAVLNAGIHEHMDVRTFSADTAARVMAVNYLGIVNALEVLIPLMTFSKHGQIALMGSLSGYRGETGQAAYAPSKAAIISLAECLLPELLREGIQISVINPGVVDTQMTARMRCAKIPAAAAADHILAGLHARKFEIAFPLSGVVRTKLLQALPSPVFHWRACRRNNEARRKPS